MKYTVLTLFPGIVDSYFSSSIMAKAITAGILSREIINFRDFAFDKHKTCDDAPYGGGPGMILKPEPLGAALDSIDAKQKRVIFPSPGGKLFNQAYAQELSTEKELVVICGRYEGVDQRIIDLYVDDEISLGDYVISSGELAALVLIDAVYRLVEGVIRGESLEEESFTHGLLEYPQYTRPEIYQRIKVPDVLLSGHHAKIKKWRLQKQIEKTNAYRPELLSNSNCKSES